MGEKKDERCPAPEVLTLHSTNTEEASLVMVEIRPSEIIPFQELEATVWKMTVEAFSKALVEVLTRLDQAMHQARDSQRYVLKEMRQREVLTRVGPISFQRHYYWDCEEERCVFLLDEALGLEKRQRVSEGVRADAVEAAVAGTSYRKAAAELERRDCQVTVSHEAIRQWTLQTGNSLQDEVEREAMNPAGKRRVPVLFIEADGFWPARQRSKRQETKIFVSHEGWEPRTPGSKDYRLVNRQDFVASPKGDVWEEYLSWLESQYDLSDTWVVINGDRAPWIRSGVESFPKAMYQVDRFHLVREVRMLLKSHPEQRKAARRARKGNDAAGFLAALGGALAEEQDAKRQAELEALRNDLQTMPEATRDYRVRLREKGVNTDGMRGLGSAESAVERYSQRTRKCGRSWSETGLQAVLLAVRAYFKGTLRGAVHVVEERLGLLPLKQAQEVARTTAVEAVGRGLDAARHAHLPALECGTTGSGGLSKLFRSLASA
jgi:hypothetical protein